MMIADEGPPTIELKPRILVLGESGDDIDALPRHLAALGLDAGGTSRTSTVR
ncbi:MAG: hypothetical protein J0I45_01845 [Bosea sp.]|nr:hypothetical protein [Bosea sp. (in: a-proteobacteria)]